MPWRVAIPGHAFAPVIVFIPRSDDGCKPGEYDAEWLPRQCPLCGQAAIVGHGRRRRQAREGRPLEPERTRAVFEKIVAAGVPHTFRHAGRRIPEPADLPVHGECAGIDRLVFELYGLNEEEMRIAGGEAT